MCGWTQTLVLYNWPLCPSSSPPPGRTGKGDNFSLSLLSEGKKKKADVIIHQSWMPKRGFWDGRRFGGRWKRFFGQHIFCEKNRPSPSPLQISAVIKTFFYFTFRLFCDAISRCVGRKKGGCPIYKNLNYPSRSFFFRFLPVREMGVSALKIQ